MSIRARFAPARNAHAGRAAPLARLVPQLVTQFMACALALGAHAHAQLAPQPASPPASANAGAPHIVFDKELGVDFGRIPDTKAMTARFAFRNEGTTPLRIVRVNSSCGCTEPVIEGVAMPPRKDMAIENAVYQPGEGSEIRIDFKPGGKSGQQNQKVTIITNDPSRPSIELPVHAFVLPNVRVEPDVLALGSLEPTSQRSWTVRVLGADMPHRLEPFDVTHASVSGQREFAVSLGARERVSTEFGEAWARDVELRYLGTGTPGPLRGALVIRTNDPKRWLLSVMFEGSVQGALQVEPKLLRLGNALVLGSPASSSVTITHPKQAPFSVVSVIDATTRQPVRHTVAEGGQAVAGAGVRTVTLTFPTTRPGPLRGSVLIQTDIPGEPALEVAFVGNVAQPGPATNPTAEPSQPPTPQPGEQPKAPPTAPGRP